VKVTWFDSTSIFKEKTMHRRKAIRLVGVLLLTFAAIVGALATGQEGQTTRLLLWDGDWGANDAAVDALVAAFNEANPDIEVVREPQSNMQEIARTALDAGVGPDILKYDSGPGFAGVLARAGLLHPLEDAYQQYGWDERILDVGKQRATFDGTTYGIGHELEFIGMFYNQRIFEELGLSEPQSHDELLRLCEELSSAGYYPISFGNQGKWPAGHVFSTFAGNIVGREHLTNAISGKADWDTPEVVAAIDIPLVQMREAGCYNSDINAVNYDDANLLFYSGQAPMILTGTWMIPDYSDPDTMPDPVGFFFYPPVDGKPVAPPAGLGSAYWVSNSTENPEAAFRFLDYLFSEEAAQVWLEELRVIPAVAGLDTSGYDIPELLSFTLENLEENRDSMGYNIDVLMPANFVTVMEDGFQNVIEGRKSAEQQAADLQRAMEEAREAGEIMDITD
jgi:raffinose/stachyose/melibiose transport system substrate-binding protein